MRSMLIERKSCGDINNGSLIHILNMLRLWVGIVGMGLSRLDVCG